MGSMKEPVHFFKLPDIASSPNQSVNTPNNVISKEAFVSDSNQGSGAMETHDGFQDDKPKFPKIIVRDIVGRELDTDTSYQRAIYEAKWKVSKGEGPSVPEEWRLPHGKIPARPDYSRTAPPVALKRLYKKEMKKQRNKMYQSHPGFPEALEADKSFEPLRWSLQQTETLPALVGANLLNDFDRLPSRTYMPFVGMAPVVNRSLEEIDKREAEYIFPGFCYGCSKGTGLCYGCERDSRPHFHHDKPHKTGGGFSYYKRDRIFGEIPSKNPANWKISLPPPRGLPPTTYVFYDENNQPTDFQKYGVKVRVTQLPEHSTTYPRDAFTATDTAADDQGVSRGSRREVTFITESGDSGLAITYPGSSPGDGAFRVDFGQLSSGTTYDQLMPTLREYTSHDDDEEEELPSESEHLRKEPTSGKTELTETDDSGESDKKRLYKAPKPFQLKAKEKKVTIAVDPFSKDREYDIPKGDGIQIKKSDKKLTEFDEFNFGDGTWEEPKPFEFKDRPDTVPTERKRPEVPEPVRKAKTTVTETKPKEIKPKPTPQEPGTRPKKEVKPRNETTPPKPKGAKPAKTEKPVSPPELVDIPKAASPLPPEQELETVVEEDEIPPSPSKTPTPPQPGKPEKKQRVVVKKERKQREPPVRKTRRETEKDDFIEETPEEELVEEKTLTPEPEVVEPEPEPEPEVPLIPVREKRKLPSPPPMRRVAPPPLPRAIPAVPPLPREYTDPDRPTREVSQTLLEAPPPMFEPPKQRRPPPMKRPKAKPREFRLPQVRTSETPSTKPELKDITDPLDYLAKYCIIHKDRLPLYERVFRKVVKEQMYRYVDVPHDTPEQIADDLSQSETKGKTPPPMKTKLEDHEKKMINDLTIINRSTREEFAKTGFNHGDQNVSKTHYILDTLIDKYEELQEKHDKLQGDRIILMAEIAKEKFPEVAKLNYKPKSKKKKRKKKKKTESPSGEVMFDKSTDVAVQTDGDSSPRAPRRVTEVDIVSRLNKKMTEEVNNTAEVTQLNMEITRLQEKLRDVDDRIEDLEDEKKLLQLYSRDEFQQDITRDAKPEVFLRRQSALYRKMHEQNDEEMNVSELEEALQQINGHLISEKELQFIYHILDIPGRRRINLQLFSVIAALSEKVKQVDPFIRKLINKFNYEALNVKMDRSKELFWLLDEKEDGVPSGKITSSSLALELAAGGVTPEHTQYVVNKFSRENKGIVDFMDYLTYVPLFIEIHGRIIDDPLASDRVF